MSSTPLTVAVKVNGCLFATTFSPSIVTTTSSFVEELTDELVDDIGPVEEDVEVEEDGVVDDVCPLLLLQPVTTAAKVASVNG